MYVCTQVPADNDTDTQLHRCTSMLHTRVVHMYTDMRHIRARARANAFMFMIITWLWKVQLWFYYM